MPMLVEEMYKSMVDNLDGVEPPYSLETVWKKVLICLLFDFSFCSFRIFSTRTAPSSTLVCSLQWLRQVLHKSSNISTKCSQEKDPKLAADEKTAREKVKLDKVIRYFWNNLHQRDEFFLSQIIGALEDVVQLDTINKKHIFNLKFKTTYRGWSAI